MTMKYLQNSIISKNMKRLLLFIFLIPLSISVWAQPEPNSKDFEVYRAKRVSFMTEKLNLNPEEAQKFWPIYNAFDQSRGKLHKEQHELERTIKDGIATMKSNELEKINQRIVNLYFTEAKLVAEYNEKFKAVLPIQKVILIGPTENEFRYKMIREYRQKNHQ